MCIPYASDSAGAPVGGLAGLAGTPAPALPGLTGTNVPTLPNLTGSGIVPTMPTAGGTVLSGGSANTGLPGTPSPPSTEPVASPPPVAAPAPAPAAKTFGVDPLPQTSGHFDPVSQAGHESLSPLADAIIERRSRKAPTPTPSETAALPNTVPAASTGPAAAAALAPGALPDVAVVESYIRKKAAALGVDPDVAVAVAKSEGLSPGTWQSNIAGGGGPGNREPSFGPFQLHDKYMGADFTRQTGLRASDPNTWQQQIDFVLGNVSRTGWEPFHGAARVGIGPRQGLPGVSDTSPSGGYAANGAPLIAFGTPAARTVASADITGSSGGSVDAGSRGDDTLAPRTRSIEYANRQKTRNKPLSPQLESEIDRATAPEGVTTRVVSGGQDATGPNRTGSHRHDEKTPGSGGQAGDVQFIKDGRILDMTNPADLEIIKRIMGRLWGSGVQGLGGSPNYMGSQIFHVGYGKPAVWGAGGQGANAPEWLRQIAASGGIPSAGGAAVAGGAAGPPPATGGGGIISRLAGVASGVGGGGGSGAIPKSGMAARVEEFLVADAARRKRERDRMPDIGDLGLLSQGVMPRSDTPDVASLAEILGVS